MARFSFSPVTLRDLVATRYFVVPKYQRSYAWSLEEIEDFWADILSAITEGGEYFFGNIVLTESEDGERFSVVDGQQRIASTTLLFAAIRDVFLEDDKEQFANAIENEMVCALDTSSYTKTQRIQLNELDNTFYKEFIIDKSQSERTKESHRLIDQAYTYFRERLLEIKDSNPSTWEAEYGKISAFFRSNARVVVVTAASDADAFIIFETLNDRGADLTIADLLKNYLFSKSGTEIDAVQNSWIEARTVLEEYQGLSDFITFLRHYWSSTHGMTRERELYREIKGNISTKSQAVKFSKELSGAARLYGAAVSDKSDFWKDYPETTKNNLRLLFRLKLEQNRPLLLAILQHFDPNEIQKTIPSLVSWSVRGLIGGVMGKGKAETTFCDTATQIRSGAIKTRDQLSAGLSSLVPNDTSFQAAFSTYRTNNNAFARYLMYGIERSLQSEAQPEFVPNENVDEVNLEHILPRRPKADKWPSFHADEVSFYATKLGNLTILKEADNSKIGNKPWDTKKPALISSSFKLNNHFASLEDWTKLEIEDRQTSLAKEAVKVWKK